MATPQHAVLHAVVPRVYVWAVLAAAAWQLYERILLILSHAACGATTRAHTVMPKPCGFCA